MDQKDIEIFLNLTKTKNLTKTAENLFMTQSTISSRLNSLEKKTGTKLIERSRGSRAIKLTPYGERFKKIAEQIFELSQEAMKMKKDTIINLNIGIIDSFNNVYFDKILVKLYNLLKNYNINIKVCNSSEIYDLIELGLLDIGIVSLRESRNNVIVKPIYNEKMCIICNYPEIMPKKIDAKDLNLAEELYLNWGDNFLSWHKRNFKNSPKPKLELNSMHLVKNIFRNYRCWAVSTYEYAVVLSKDIEIQIIYTKDFIEDRTLYMVRQKETKPWKEKGINFFVESLKSYL